MPLVTRRIIDNLRLNWEFLPDWSFSPQAKWIIDRSRSLGDNRPPVADYTWVDLTLRRQNLAKHVEAASSVRILFGEVSINF